MFSNENAVPLKRQPVELATETIARALLVETAVVLHGRAEAFYLYFHLVISIIKEVYVKVKFN